MQESNIPPLLESLQSDLRYYADYLRGLSREMLDSGVSKYPVYIAYQDGEVKLGRPILLRNSLGTSWNISASVLEELVQRQVVRQDKIQTFIHNYKDPEEYLCVFVASHYGPGFVYFPFLES
jgi:hypothetical protein